MANGIQENPIEYDEVDEDIYILEEDYDLFDWCGGL